MPIFLNVTIIFIWRYAIKIIIDSYYSYSQEYIRKFQISKLSKKFRWSLCDDIDYDSEKRITGRANRLLTGFFNDKMKYKKRNEYNGRIKCLTQM